MKKHEFPSFSWQVLFSFCSCQSSKEKAFQTIEGVASVVTKLNDAFWKNASYTDFTISYIKGEGTTISDTGTQDYTSPKLVNRLHSQGDWEDVRK